MAIQRKGKGSGMADLLDSVSKAVQKKYGVDGLVVLSKHPEFGKVTDFISFGHFGLDAITGGGAPCGRLTELYGAFSSGKSLMIAQLIAECQKAGGVACLDDCEHAYLADFGASIGVNNDELLYCASETVEEVFDKMEITINAILAKDPNALVLYCWDSVAAVSSKEEMETDMGDSDGFGTAKAKAITKGTRKLVGLIGKHRIALVVANQMKKAVGVMFGSQETTPGGDAIPFWASLRMRLGKGELIRKDGKADGEVMGVRGQAETKKNKVCRPFQKTTFDIMFDEGLIYTSGCVEHLMAKGVITSAAEEGQKNSGYYFLGGDTKKKWRKRELEEYFADNKDTLESLL
jgi:recombination protein RecA